MTIKYEQILTSLLRSDLDLQEKGLLCFMSTHHPDFRFHGDWLAKECHCSRGRIIRIMTNLKEKGYISVIVERNGKKIVDRYYQLNRELVIYKKAIEDDFNKW